MTPLKHAKWSPSSMGYREMCPSWEPGNATNAHPLTDRGTAMHLAVETGDDSKLEGREVEYVEDCRRQIEQAQYITPGGEESREVRLHTSIPNLWGTIDFLRLYKNHAYAMDWKFGFVKVDDPEINAQAASYVLGIFDQFSEIKVVTFKFVMPRLKIALRHTFVREQYDSLKHRLQTIIARCEANPKKVNPSQKACQFCGNLGRCGKVVDAVLPLAKKYADGLPELPEECHPSLITDPAQMARALRVAKVFSEFASSCAKHALDLSRKLNLPIEDPARGIYFEEVSRAGKKKITNPTLAWSEAQELGISQQEFLDCCEVKVTKLKNAVNAKLPRGDKKKGTILFLEKLRAADALTDSPETQFLTLKKNK